MRAIGIVMALLLALAVAAADKKDELTPAKRQELDKKAGELNQEGFRHYAAGEYVKARDAWRSALEIRRTLYPKKDYPQGHLDLAGSINNLAFLYYSLGAFAQTEPLYKEALAIYRALFPKDKFPQGHQHLANSLNNLATLYQAAAENDKAEPLFQESLAMYRTLFPKEKYPQGNPELAATIGNLATLYLSMGDLDKAEALYKEDLEMSRTLFPKEKFPRGHPDLAMSLNNLAYLYKAARDYARAESLYKEALATYRTLFPKTQFPQGHPDLANSINNLAMLYQAATEYGKAEPLFTESLAMYRAVFPKAQYPDGHPRLAQSLSNLANMHLDAGEHGKAEPLFKESLAMYRALFPKNLYPKGHPLLARSMMNLASGYFYAAEYAKAEPLNKEALDMNRALYSKETYPLGHPDLAESCNNLGMVHHSLGHYAGAEPLLKEARAMYRTLYPKEKFPKGHPDLAGSINNLAMNYHRRGDYDQAEPLYKEARTMCRDLYSPEQYPQGHSDLATNISNLAFLYHAEAKYDQAVPLAREALTMFRGMALSYADLLAEAEALNYVATQPRIRDILLASSRHVPEMNIYEALWDSRAALTRLQERRHRDLMASRDKATTDLADQLHHARSDLARRLLNPLRDAEQQRAVVQKLTDAKEDLEKRIAARLRLAPQSKASSPTPKQLAQTLPQGTAFVDLYEYIDLENDPAIKGKKGEKQTRRYVAFVLRPGKAAARIDLKEADPIDEAWTAWHKAIVADRPDDKREREAAATFADLVWEPIRAVLPAEVKTIYLVPDGLLHQVPWGALPGKKPDKVLLDECAIALVPHGPFLLEHLQKQQADRAGDTLLAYGGVDYAGQPGDLLKHEDVRGPLLSEKKRIKWSDLPGTAKEQEQIVALAKRALKADPISRSGRNANTRQLEEDLPKVRYAHLATHGFFADPEFRSAIQVDPKLLESQSTGERRGGARSPSVLSGLVLAGANRQGDDAAADRGIITAEGLIGLRLEGLELAVLSACETGLGEDGGGEGVYGLQRAFHVAGCKNVIASLWKVDDGATQALMALFYRNLWEKKLDAAEALRQAQLTLYRHPEAVAVAQKRGVDFSESDLPKVEEKPTEKPQRSPTAHWAAFTFSGVRPAK